MLNYINSFLLIHQKVLLLVSYLTLMGFGVRTLWRTYRRPWIPVKERTQIGAYLVFIAMLLLVAISVFKEVLGLAIIGRPYGGSDFGIALFIGFTQFTVPFVFGGIGAGMVLNSIINGKPTSPAPEWRD